MAVLSYFLIIVKICAKNIHEWRFKHKIFIKVQLNCGDCRYISVKYENLSTKL